jgi:hypothetical protein
MEISDAVLNLSGTVLSSASQLVAEREREREREREKPVDMKGVYPYPPRTH